MQRTDTSDTSHEHFRGERCARVFVEEPGRPPRVVTIPRGTAVRVGRGEEAEIRVDDLRVSRLHLALRNDDGQLSAQELGSSNGTYLSGERLVGVVPLVSGALLEVGSCHLVVAYGEALGATLALNPVLGATAVGPDVVAVDPATVRLFALVKRLAPSDLPILLQGETGTGKEVVAQALHRHSGRSGGPFVAINCGSLPESIAESELFGHEKGSFTGASARRRGVFETADGGTLLLDEVGELSQSNQVRLLRVLQERVIARVGANRPVPVNVRVVAATNRQLAVEVARKTFREDLYFRLSGMVLEIPPLRDRPRDLMPLVSKFLEERGTRYALGPGVAAALQAYRWPGNIRELRHAIECAMAVAEGLELRVEHLPTMVRGGSEPPPADNDLKDRVTHMERQAVVAALESTSGNQSRAARVLGISRRGLIYKMERFGLKALPPSERRDE